MAAWWKMRYPALCQLFILFLTISSVLSRNIYGNETRPNDVNHSEQENNKIEWNNAEHHADIKTETSGRSSGKQYFDKISEHPACADDVKYLCGTSKTARLNNLNVLMCLQNIKDEDQPISRSCQEQIWKLKMNLTQSDRFYEAATEICKTQYENLPCQTLGDEKGQLLACLVEHKDVITGADCREFLTKLEAIIFSDYHLIYKFADACNKDLDMYKCKSIQVGPHRDNLKFFKNPFTNIRNKDSCKIEIHPMGLFNSAYFCWMSKMFAVVAPASVTRPE